MAGTDVTIVVAVGAGVISFLSPCVLPRYFQFGGV